MREGGAGGGAAERGAGNGGGAGGRAAAALPDPDSFQPGESGTVAGVRRIATSRAADLLIGLGGRVLRTGARVDAIATRGARRDVLVLSVYRPTSEALEGALGELRDSHHAVRVALGCLGEPPPVLREDTLVCGLEGGKFQNLNTLVRDPATPDAGAFDWVLVLDDDVDLPRRFLDRFVALCERFGLALAQPAQTRSSHAAWVHTRHRLGSVVRETRFVEIGPVTAFGPAAAAELLPFPDVRFGWGLDLHWGAVAAERGWRLGVVDATPIRHERAPVAAAYRHDEATEEGRRLLAERPYLSNVAARETLATHRGLRYRPPS